MRAGGQVVRLALVALVATGCTETGIRPTSTMQASDTADQILEQAELVVTKVNDLLEAGVAANQIGVITPYAAQARLLREKLLMSDLEIDTVDGFQGREKEAIVISLVRSNERGEIGFLSDLRRMNVAMTRARRELLVIGDSATLSADPFYARLIAHFESQGAYHTVWEEDGAA